MAATTKSSAGQPPLLRDVFSIKPKSEISTSDFVLKLAEAVTPEGAQAALKDYVITDRLVENYDEALGLIGSALQSQSSKAAYLHGSFGSGKSHFMAVLYALLHGDLAARGKDEFARLLAKHEATLNGRKFLLVPYYLMSAKSLEQCVLGGYVKHITALHPDAPTPRVYRTDALFQDIQQLRANVGDEAFIAKLGRPVAGSGAAGDVSDASEWGDESDAAVGPGGADADTGVGDWGRPFAWTTELLEIALNAPEDNETERPAADGSLDPLIPRTPGELRARLVQDALLGWFPGFAANAAENEFGFISLDRGLGVIAEHAKSLGYDGLILFLDELILWLANSISDQAFVAREVKKIQTFVEGGDARRAVPVVSFIARQRDLRELVGESASGAAEVAIQDTLNLASGRFDVITLEDRNLPVIAHKRLLQPVDSAAEAAITDAFTNAQRVRPEVWDTLLGSDEGTTGADADSFRLTYPFSPAFMDTLVHISNALQRSRTGLKLMGQLLAEHRDEARLNQLIPLGDLYELLADGGDEPFTEKLKAEFHAAQKLYRTKLRPFLLDSYSITEEDVERSIHGHPQADPKLEAQVRSFRGDNRFICTLLLSALAPSVPALRDLTNRRLAALNHGSIVAPIPGTEVGILQKKITDWASRFPEIKVTGTEANPGVRLELVDVNVDSVINNARVNNTPGNRRALIRRLLAEELGVTRDAQPRIDRAMDRIEFVWRGSQRSIELVIGNIADENDLEDPAFTPVGDDQWRLIVDLPYDEGSFRPADDRARAVDIKNKAGGADVRTVCWIPAHFTEQRREDFERLVIIESALGNPQRYETNYAVNLNPSDRQRAKVLLEGQRDTLTGQIKRLLAQAYGLASRQPGDITEFTPEFVPFSEVQVRTRPGQSLHAAARHIGAELLAHQYPGHPNLDVDQHGLAVRPEHARTVFGYVRAAAESRDGIVDVQQRDRPLMRRLVGPLRLGTQHEARFELGRHWVEHFNRRIGADHGDVSVVTLTDWLDEPQPMGLDDFLAHLIIAAYAEQEDRVWVRAGSLLEPQPAGPHEIRKADSCRRQPLPDQSAWDRARERAYAILGLPPSPNLLRSRIVGQLAGQITAAARQRRDAAHELVTQLERQAKRLGLDVNTAGESDDSSSSARLVTARRAAELLDVLCGTDAYGGGATASAKRIITALADFDLGTIQPDRLAKSITSAQAVVQALANKHTWSVLQVAEGRGHEADHVLGALYAAARADELTSELEAALDKAQRAILDLVRTPSPPTPAPEAPTADDVPLGTSTSQPPIPGPAHVTGAAGNRAARRSGNRQVRASAALNALQGELAELLAREPEAVIDLSWKVVE